MKFSDHTGLAAMAFLMLAACNEKPGDGERPSLADTEAAAELARREAGDLPATAPTGAMENQTPSSAEQSSAAAASPGEPAAAPAPPAAFLQCRSCHSVEPGKHGLGPSLAGIAGKPAASVDGFSYSTALRQSGIVWDRAKLDEWLAGPTRMVPGARMVVPVRSDEQRKAIIDYMETLQ